MVSPSLKACHTPNQKTPGGNMRRRQFMAGAATLAAGPSLSRPAIAGPNKVLTFVPTTAPPTYDPLFSFMSLV